MQLPQEDGYADAYGRCDDKVDDALDYKADLLDLVDICCQSESRADDTVEQDVDVCGYRYRREERHIIGRHRNEARLKDAAHDDINYEIYYEPGEG